MPKPHRHQATWVPRASIPTSIALTRPPRRAWECLLRACRCVAQALAHEGNGDATGKEGVGHPQERDMPKPHRHQATWTPRASIPTSIALTRPSRRAWGCLLRACRCVAQALEHTGTGGTTGEEGVVDAQERAMPKPHLRQATWAPRANIPTSIALTRPPMALVGAPECCSGARARRERRHHW